MRNQSASRNTWFLDLTTHSGKMCGLPYSSLPGDAPFSGNLYLGWVTGLAWRPPVPSVLALLRVVCKVNTSAPRRAKDSIFATVCRIANKVSHDRSRTTRTNW